MLENSLGTSVLFLKRARVQQKDSDATVAALHTSFAVTLNCGLLRCRRTNVNLLHFVRVFAQVFCLFLLQNTYAKAVLLLGSMQIRQLKDIFEVVVHLCIKILQRCKYYAPISSEVSKERKYKKDISHISSLDSHLFFETLSQVILILNNVFFPVG